MDATITCRSTFMVVFSSIEAGLRSIDASFPLENLSCMKDYLALQAREKEIEEEDSSSESESSGASPPSPKGAPGTEQPQLEGQHPLPNSEPPQQLSLPGVDASSQTKINAQPQDKEPDFVA